MNATTPVFYRMEDGEPLAIFPTIPGTNDPDTCTVYRHTGQHGHASTDYPRTLPRATPEQAAPLASELERIGYTDLRTVKQFHATDRAARIEAMKLKTP